MRHTTCLLTPARALHRALLLQLANTTSKSNGISPTTLASSSAVVFRAHIHTSPPTSKRAAAAAPAPAPAPYLRTRHVPTPPGQRVRPPTRKNPINDDIPYSWVRVADASGALSAPQRTSSVVLSLPKGHTLIMVAPPPSTPSRTTATGGGGGMGADETPGILQPPSAAICRIVDTAAQKAAAASAALETRRQAQQTKTLEINWAIAPHDLGHRMRRLAEFLGKGMRVEVMLARKRGTRKATADEASALADAIREVAEATPGCTEYKKADGVVGGVFRMFFEGPKPKEKAKVKAEKEEKKGKGKKEKEKEKGDGEGGSSEVRDAVPS
ncbi:putative translation initiation factor IF-3 [Rosellinia necatrix]|uniref:Putative translation initiation factor IF-3 n=1 Tax=Rosellinia necatrix TaxID=77044 RepID=A0A1W2TWX6_ROSNE|nr:putative translation initiation factor IF-3 [Rosellinia necatrix]